MSAVIETKILDEKREFKEQKEVKGKDKESVYNGLVDVKEIVSSFDEKDFLDRLETFLKDYKNHREYNYLLKFFLFECVKKNKIKEVEYLLSIGVNIDTLDEDKNTPLIIAAGFSSVAMVEFLIFKSVDIYRENNEGFNPYLFAIKHNNSEVVKYLERKFTSFFDRISKNGITPFMAACYAGNTDAMERYIKHTSIRYSHDTSSGDAIDPFIAATLSGSVPAMKWILNKVGKDYNRYHWITPKGVTPFLAAAHSGSIPAMEFILSKDKEAHKKNDSDGMTPLMYAIGEGHIPAMEFIYNLDPDSISATAVSNGGELTPLICSILSSNPEVMEWVLRKDPKAFWKDRKGNNGVTPLMVAASLNRISHINTILKLNSSSLNEVDSGGNTALHKAAEKGYLAAVELLVSKGIRWDLPNSNVKDALDIAETNKHTDVVKYLDQVEGLMLDVAEGRTLALQKWVLDGNTLNLRDKYGDSLLHIALKDCRYKIALYLLKQGLSKDLKNINGETPFQCCLKTGVENLWHLFKKMSVELYSEKNAEKIEELKKEFRELVQVAIDSPSIYGKMDYEFLAINVDKKYWRNYAEELAEVSKISKSGSESNQDYIKAKEKLSHLIYSHVIICKGQDKKGKFHFEIPSASAEATADRETKEKFIETEKERYNRLSWALKFAMQAEDFKSAMRISVEMTSDDETFTELNRAQERDSEIVSKDDFVLAFMQYKYRPKTKEPYKLDKPEVTPIDEPPRDESQNSGIITPLDI